MYLKLKNSDNVEFLVDVTNKRVYINLVTFSELTKISDFMYFDDYEKELDMIGGIYELIDGKLHSIDSELFVMPPYLEDEKQIEAGKEIYLSLEGTFFMIKKAGKDAAKIVEIFEKFHNEFFGALASKLGCEIVE